MKSQRNYFKRIPNVLLGASPLLLNTTCTEAILTLFDPLSSAGAALFELFASTVGRFVGWLNSCNCLCHFFDVRFYWPAAALLIFQEKRSCTHMSCPSRMWIVIRAASTFAPPTMVSANPHQVRLCCMSYVSILPTSCVPYVCYACLSV